MFRSHSDNLQGAHIFLIKVTDFKICFKCKKDSLVMRQHAAASPH